MHCYSWWPDAIVLIATWTIDSIFSVALGIIKLLYFNIMDIIRYISNVSSQKWFIKWSFHTGKFLSSDTYGHAYWIRKLLVPVLALISLNSFKWTIMIVLREFVNYRGTIVIVLLLPIVIRNDDQSCLDCLCSHWSPRGVGVGDQVKL